MTVENYDGQPLGKLKDFVLSVPSGQTEYALISSGGFLGFGKRLTVVPAQAISTATAKKRTLALDISKARWRQALSFSPGRLSALSTEQAQHRIRSFFLRDKTTKGQREPSSAGADPRVVPGSPPTARTGHPGGLHLASALMGRSVISRHGVRLGRVSDLLLDLSGTGSSVAIVSSGGLLGASSESAVPLARLGWSGDSELVLSQTEHPPLSFQKTASADAWARADARQQSR